MMTGDRVKNRSTLGLALVVLGLIAIAVAGYFLLPLLGMSRQTELEWHFLGRRGEARAILLTTFAGAGVGLLLVLLGGFRLLRSSSPVPGPDLLPKRLGVSLLIAGAIVAAVGVARIETHAPVDVMDTSRAREILPGVRNEMGAVLDNMLRRDTLRARSARSQREATPWIALGAGVGGIGLIVVVMGAVARSHPESGTA